MSAVAHKLLVVGGNGFIGSAVCRTALTSGMQVTSISSSGQPYKTPKGHSPEWVSRVKWIAADALDPSSYEKLLPHSTAVVHTLGTLFDDLRYKKAMKDGDVPAFLSSVWGNVSGGSSRNPLRSSQNNYERLNRDSALRVCESFIASKPDASISSDSPRPFIYLSAEDMLRPVLSSRYIETKREAEKAITTMISGLPNFRAVHIRPSFVYHAHLRPLTTPLAAILDLSSTVHRKLNFLPTPASVLRFVGSAIYSPSSTPPEDVDSSSLHAMARALTIPPIHVDHVAKAICLAVEDSEVTGVLNVQKMRELVGWTEAALQSQ